MPAKKASKPKRKSSSSTLTKYSRSRPLGPELKMVRRKYAKLYCWLRLSYANPSSTLSLSGTGPNQRIGRTIVVKEIEIKINMQAAWAYVGATVPSAAGISYRVDLILTSKQTGRCPWSRHLRHTRCRCISRKSVHELAQQ